jgi:DNA replicative helicase MCM subunit Mcm2 (Cdc46/Mcm family)
MEIMATELNREDEQLLSAGVNTMSVGNLYRSFMEYINFPKFEEVENSQYDEYQLSQLRGFLFNKGSPAQAEKDIEDAIELLNSWGFSKYSLDDFKSFFTQKCSPPCSESPFWEDIQKVNIRDITKYHFGKEIVVECILRSFTKPTPTKKITNICSTCSSPIEIGTKFCKFCGTKKIEQVTQLKDVIKAIFEERVEKGSKVNFFTLYVEFTKDVEKVVNDLQTHERYLLKGEVKVLAKGKGCEYYLEVGDYKHIEDGISSIKLVKQDIELFRQMASSPDIKEELIHSIFNYGDFIDMEVILEAVLLLLVGSPKRYDRQGGLQDRGNLMLLIVSNPGSAKSRLLYRLANFFPKSRVSSGASASGIGLTASVQKDDKLGDYVVTPGAIPLCHPGGVSCIDELSLFNPQEMSKLNTMMTDLVIPVDKASVHIQLPSDVSILAAMNPTGKTWDVYAPTKIGQVNLPQEVKDRFDMIFDVNYFVKVSDSKTRDKIGYSILSRHSDTYHYLDEEGKKKYKSIKTYPLDIVLKYIAYCRKINPYFPPSISEHIIERFNIMIGMKVLPSDYTNNNSDNMGGDDSFYSPRLLESFSRLVLANARVKLKDKPDASDVFEAEELLLNSFKSMDLVKTKFISGQQVIEVDISKKEGAPTKSDAQKKKLIMELATSLNADEEFIYIEDLKEKCLFKDDFDRIFDLLREENKIMFKRGNKSMLMLT